MKKYLVFLYAFLCINLLRCSDGKPVLLPGNIGFIEEKNNIVNATFFLPSKITVSLDNMSCYQVSEMSSDVPIIVDMEKDYKLYCLTAYNDMAYIVSFFDSIRDDSPFKTITLKLFPVVQYINKELNSPIAKEQLRKDMFLLIKDIGYFCYQVKTQCESYESGDSSYHTKISPLVMDLCRKFECFIEKNKPKFYSKCPSKSIMMMESLCIVYLLICCWQVEVCGRQGISFGLQRIAALVGAGLCTFYLSNDMYYYWLVKFELKSKKQKWVDILYTQTRDKGFLEKINNLSLDIHQEKDEDIIANLSMEEIDIQTDQFSRSDELEDERVNQNKLSGKSQNSIEKFSREEDCDLNSLLTAVVSPTSPSLYDKIFKSKK